MKNPINISFFIFALSLLVPRSPAHAIDVPTQVDVRVEIYELSQVPALALQKSFNDAPDSDRQRLVTDLRTKAADESKVVAIAQSSVRLGQPSVIASIKEYRYPTMFETKDGFATPSAFETRDVGCTMQLTITSSQKDRSFAAKTEIYTVQVAETKRYPASKADQGGTIEQPIFTTERVKTHIELISDIPKLVSVYSPYKDEKNGNLLRLVFVTVELQK